MSTFYIFRHGVTYETKTHTDYTSDIYSADILPQSIEFLKKMGLYLNDIPSDFCVSSPLARCRETVEIISDISGKPFFFDSRLTEYSSHLESMQQLRDRINSFMQEITQKNYQNIQLCTHGAIISALLSAIKHQEITLDTLSVYPEPGTLLIVSGKDVKTIDFT